MFHNYKELFHAYVELYSTGLLRSDNINYSKEHLGQYQATLQLTTSPLEAASYKDKPLNIEQTLNSNGSSFVIDYNQLVGCNSNDSSTSEAISKLKPTAIATAVEELPLNDDPRLISENDRLIRLGAFNSLQAQDFLCILTIFCLLLVAKRMLSFKLKSIKQIDQLGLRAKDRERIDESIWRLLYYTFSSACLIYSSLQHDSLKLLTNQPLDSIRYSFVIDWSAYSIFMIEAAFYLHATYALVFEDVWRRDSPMMLVHHLAAVFTTLSIYATRTHQIGLISTVMRDTCDVLLEVTKLTKCLHIQHGKRVQSLGMAINCFLSVFAAAFAINQLYYFPLFCLFHGLRLIKLYSLQTPVMLGIMTCGLVFLLLDLLWFGLILRLLYYMVLAKPMKDLREYDDEDDDLIESSDDGEQQQQRECKIKCD